MRVRLALLAMWLGARPAQAAPGPNEAALAASVAMPGHRAAVLDAVRNRNPSWFFRQCEAATFTPVAGVTVWRATNFDATGEPTEGEWVERVTATGCGVSRTFAVASVAHPDGTVALRDIGPGRSLASPSLHDKAANAAWAAATAFNPPGCKDDYVDDTVVIGRHVAGTPVWSERWTLRVCHRAVVVDVDYRILYAGDDVRARRITPRYANELAHPPATH